MSALDVGRLLGELEEQRRQRGGVCTTSINVVAFIEQDEQLLRWMLEKSETFAEAHRFRILLLDASQTQEAHAVRTRCYENNETLVTSLEQIQLGVRGMDAANLRSLVHDLLVPNLRTVLLWGGERVRDERFRQLSELAECIILFSAGGPDALRSLHDVAEIEGTPLAGQIRDLAFMRLMPWQEMIAQFFDDADLITELATISEIEITCGTAPEAYYFAAWFAGRLGWEPTGTHEFRSSQGASVALTIRQAGLPRRMQSVRLRSNNCVFGAAVSSDADDLICLTVEGRKPRPQRCVPLHSVDIASLLERAIFSETDRGVFGETLGMLRKLFEGSARS